jgi:hypothetical protein
LSIEVKKYIGTKDSFRMPDGQSSKNTTAYSRLKQVLLNSNVIVEERYSSCYSNKTIFYQRF